MLWLDFETRCSLDLTEVGLYNYAAKAEVICTAWCVDDGPVMVAPGLPYLPGVLDEGVKVAHNAGFERAILAAQGLDTPWERWVDTAAMAASMSLPRKLEHLAVALKLGAQKDMAGARVMKKLSRPKKGYGTHEFWTPEERPGDFAALYEYCRQDVVVMREAYRRMLALTAQEAALLALTGRMNDRGVPVDLASIRPAQEVLERLMTAGEARFKQLSGGPGLRSYARAAPALGLPDMTKPTVRRALRDPATPPRVREALDLFLHLAKSSPAKLSAMQVRSSPDGRSRGMLVYAGAERTGRWSGAGVQPQNFPKGMGERTDEAFIALHAGAFEMVYDHPVESITEMLRGFFAGPFLVGDYAQIEARVLAWLAGQADVVKMFAEHGDPYCAMASKIYGRPITKKEHLAERFMGKQVTLGAGYGLGPGKFQKILADVYDTDIDLPFACRVISTYRAANSAIVALWKRVGEAAKHVVMLKRKEFRVTSNISMGMTGVGGLHYLWIQIPSGRRLYYCEPEMVGDGLEYWGRNPYKGGKWDRVRGYGGKFVENITQALSRDLMGNAMLRLEEQGFKLVATIHDEIVAEDNGLLSAFKEVMLSAPAWARGLPVDVEVFQCARYRK